MPFVAWSLPLFVCSSKFDRLFESPVPDLSGVDLHIAVIICAVLVSVDRLRGEIGFDLSDRPEEPRGYAVLRPRGLEIEGEGRCGG